MELSVKQYPPSGGDGHLKNPTATAAFTIPRRNQTNLDFDLLVSNVEGSIMADQERAVMALTPQELLLKSNPGVYSNNALRDLTNPREMYSLLSHRTKSTEDLATKLKQELSRSLGTFGSLPKLSRTASMHEIQRTTSVARLNRMGNKQYKSTADISRNDNSVDVLVLRRNKTTIGDIRATTEDNKENVRGLNLPHLHRTNFGSSSYENRLGVHTRLELPTLPEGQVLQRDFQTAANDGNATFADQPASRKKISTSDSKLDRWFADMPNEVFDKAQRAILEESIKEKLQKYQKNRKRNNFPHPNVHVYVGSKLKRIPNTYLELHVDSFGKHLVNEDSEDKMNKYRLQQKSMHHLKMRELEDEEKLERLHEEDLTHRLNLHHRSLTNLALAKAKQTAMPNEKPKKEVISIPTDKIIKTVNMNDRIELSSDHFLKHRHILTNYEEYTERLAMVKAAQEQIVAMSRPPNTPEMSESSKIEGLDGGSTDQITAKPKIVNLSLPERTDKRSKKPPSVDQAHADDNAQDAKLDVPDGKVDEKMDDKPNAADGENIMQSKHDKIITKIPTAYSNRSDSTASSVNSSKNKLPLKRFNKLEVFAESNGKHRERKLATKTFNGFKTRESNLDDPSKTYLRHQQHHAPNVLKEDGEIVRSEVRMQDVVFRFEPGEVIISRGPHNKQHSNNRSSERARIIYGKVLNVKDTNKRESTLKKLEEEARENRSVITQSTRLDRYRSELARFENAAMGRNSTTWSSRDEDGVSSNAFMTQARLNSMDTIPGKKSLSMVKEKVQTRDVAIETDVIGSQPSTPSERTAKNVESAQLIRSGSEMSDFIVDNNDGESLNDTDTDVEMMESLRKNGSHSV